MSLQERIETSKALHVAQRIELAEFVGFETRNKYEIQDSSGAVIGFAAEQGKSVMQHLQRYFVGHWRRFELVVFDANRTAVLNLKHPFRFLFSRMEVTDAKGKAVGALQARFSLLRRRFDFEDASGRFLFEVNAPFWTPWTFQVAKDGVPFGLIKKKWSGVGKEMLTDADNFSVEFQSPMLTRDQRMLILAASFFIDICYFEKKAKRN